MSTLKYKCDTCKREIEILENRAGMNNFSKCIITKGCRGELYRTQRNPYNIRENFPQPSSVDLMNYNPRRTFFEYKKVTESDTWEIHHGMGVYPSVTIYAFSEDANNYIIVDREEYSISIINKNTLSIKFEEPISGIAHLVARSSLDPDPEIEEEGSEIMQVSYNNVLSIGVLGKITDAGTGQYGPTVDPIYTADLDSIFLTISIKEPNREEVFCVEEFSGNSEVGTPWTNWSALISRKRRNYSIWSKNIGDFKVVQDLYEDISEIPDGTRLQITHVRYGEDDFEERFIRARNIFILLAEEPFSISDKVLNKVVDVGTVNSFTSNNYYTFIGGELFLDSEKVEPIYPPLEIANPLTEGDA